MLHTRIPRRVLVAGLLLVLPVQAAASAVERTPNPARHISSADALHPAELNGVSALSRSDAWAVGESGDPLNHGARSLTRHWNGTKWKTVPSPSPGGKRSTWLYSVSASAPDDAWAVGSYEPIIGDAHNMSLHWDGTSWQNVDTPNPSNKRGQFALLSVSSVSPDAAFAVSYFNEYRFAHRALGKSRPRPGWILRWDGKSWLRTNLQPVGENDNVLFGTSATSASDAWVVGGAFHRGAAKTLIGHWDGTDWTVVPSPSPGSRSYLEAVSALSPTDAWAVGTYFSSTTLTDRTLTLHWDGVAWTKVPSPNPDDSSWILLGVSTVSGDEAWAVGYRLVLHWDGSAWTRVSFPVSGYLPAVSGTSATDAWVVGSYGAQTAPTAIVAHWNGRKWRSGG